nr:hypothetical protein [Tanacetum cinerariifolium]
MVPTAVLTQSKPVSITAVRPVSTVVPKTSVTRPKQVKPIVTKTNSPPKRHTNQSPSPKVNNSPPRVTVVKAPVGNSQHALKDKGVINSGCSRHMPGNMPYLSDFEELNGGYVAFGGKPKGGKIYGKGKFDGKVDEGFLVGYSSSGSTNPQNTNGDAAFDGKEPEFDEKKPESEVNVSPSRYRDLSVEFEDYSEDNINKVNVADTLVPSVGQIIPNSTNTFSAAELEDITYSDDEDDVGTEADFINLETSITVSPIPTTRVHKDHLVTQIIGFEDLIILTRYTKWSRRFMDYIKFLEPDTKSASTPIDTEKPLLKDPDGEDVDVHTYRSMIGSLMYLTSLRPDIMFVVCACAHFQVTPKASHLHAVKRIFRYLKGKPHLALWYLKDSPFDLVAYSDSDYAGASLDRKSTTGGCQFLRCRLISWQCKKQTVISTSSTKAEYVAAAIQLNAVQRHILLDYIFLGFGLTMQVVLSETHNMVAYLTKSDASEGFNQIIDFLNTSSIRLLALADKKKVVVTEAKIQEVLRLDYAEGVECLPNEKIFVELARIGYEKPSTKLTLYKAFFSSQWKKQVGDLSTYTTKYTSPALTQKVFANIRRVGKVFSGVETSLFKGMLVAQVVKEGDADENVENVNAGDAAEGDVKTTPPQSRQVQPQTPQPQPQPTQDAEIPMNLLQEVMNTCTALTRRVEHLEIDKISQALEITKLKRKVKKLERRNKGRMIAKMDQDADVVLEDDKEFDDKEVADEVKDVQDDIDVSAQDQGRKAESQAEIYKIDLEHANKVLSMQEDEFELAEVQEVADVVTTANIITEVVIAAAITAAPSRIRKGVVIRDPQEESTTSIIILAETKSKDKGKGILVEEPKPLKKQQQIEQDKKYARELEAKLNKNIDWDEVIDHVKRKAKEDHVVKKYQALKRMPHTEAQARKNMMLYLKNTKEQIDEEESRALKRINETPVERAAKRKKLDEEIEGPKRHLQIVPNEDDDVYIEASLLARKGGLRSIIEFSQRKICYNKANNVSDDFLLITLGATFEKPNIHAQI